MTRPFYESEQDRKNERAVADELLLLWNCDHHHKLSLSYGLDFALIRNGDVRVFVEIKCRPDLPFGYGDGYYISMLKVMSAFALRITTGLRTFLVIRPEDNQLYWCDFERDMVCDSIYTPQRVLIHGRKDRNDPGDYEPCAVIPWNEFIKIKRLLRGAA